jgi:hypothetical protein
MPDHFQPDPFGGAPAKLVRSFPPLPVWLARRLLRTDETITWVRGPRLSPWWERYVTHPAFLLFTLGVAALSLAASRAFVSSWSEIWPLFLPTAGCVGVASVFVLGLSAGYFTRLVVTNYRVVILQGYELCRSWSLDDLPLSLIRYGQRGEESTRTIDLDALQTMFGNTSDQFAESKTILAFGKQLDQIKARKHGRS